MTLFSSIFLKKADAEGYVAAFRRHQDPGGRGGTMANTRGSTRSNNKGESRNQSFTRRGRREEVTQKQATNTMGEDIKEPVRYVNATNSPV